MPRKSIFCIIMVSAIITTASCTGTPSDKTGTETDAITTAADSAEPEYPAPDIAAVDYGGRKLTFAIYDEKVDSRIPYSEMGVSEQNGDVFNDAFYKRDLIVAEKYNLVFTPMYFSNTGELVKTFTSSVLAGTNDIDLAFPRIYDIMSLGMNGYVCSFNDIPYVDFDAPWWLGDVISETSVSKHNYMAAGYVNTRVFEATGAVYFNKAMFEIYNLDSPYELVNSGDWTLETFMSICRGITFDVNGDSIYGLEDRYGFATNNANWMQFFASSGGRIVTKDSGDLPALSFGTQKNIDLIEKIIIFMNDIETTLLAEKYTGFPEVSTAGAGSNRRTMIPIETFTENRALFVADVVANIRQLRNMETDFGVLPPPKYDRFQEDYVAYIHPQIGTGIIIPVTNKETDMMGRVLEDLMYQSYMIVRPAMFEIVLNEKYTRDSDSAKSFEKILSGASLDLGLCLGLTIDNDVRVLIATNNTAISSVYQKNLNSNDGKIKTAIEAFND